MTDEKKRKRMRRQQASHIKKTHKAYTFRFHQELDRDIIMYLDGLDNRLGAVKKMIRREASK